MWQAEFVLGMKELYLKYTYLSTPYMAWLHKIWWLIAVTNLLDKTSFQIGGKGGFYQGIRISLLSVCITLNLAVHGLEDVTQFEFSWWILDIACILEAENPMDAFVLLMNIKHF